MVNNDYMRDALRPDRRDLRPSVSEAPHDTPFAARSAEGRRPPAFGSASTHEHDAAKRCEPPVGAMPDGQTASGDVRGETHWTRILYCDVFASAPNDDDGNRVTRVATSVLRSGAIVSAIAGAVSLAVIGVAYALHAPDTASIGVAWPSPPDNAAPTVASVPTSTIAAALNLTGAERHARTN